MSKRRKREIERLIKKGISREEAEKAWTPKSKEYKKNTKRELEEWKKKKRKTSTEKVQKPIILDKKGVKTKAGQKSSNIITTKKERIDEKILSKVNPALQKITEFITGAEFEKDKEGKLILQNTGEVATNAVLTGATGAAGRFLWGANKARQSAKLAKALSQVGKKVNVNAIGKAAGLTSKQTAALARRVGYERINILARYAVNSKSTGLTKSLLTKSGLSLGAVSLAVTAIGTYPFAGFIKEEALQTLSIPIMNSLNTNNIETARNQTNLVDEMLANQNTILDKIPFANVLKSLKEFFEAARETNEAWKEIINATEEYNKKEEEKWAEIKKQKEEERATSSEKEARKREIEMKIWRLRRQKQYDEADELERQLIEMMRSGEL